jgi:hypothetical protein
MKTGLEQSGPNEASPPRPIWAYLLLIELFIVFRKTRRDLRLNKSGPITIGRTPFSFLRGSNGDQSSFDI